MKISLLVILFSFGTVAAMAQIDSLFFKARGCISVNGGFFFMQHPHSVTSPKFISAAYVITGNISAGPVIAHYKLKEHLAFNQTSYTTKFPTDNIKIHQLMIGVKGTYYLNDLIKNYLSLDLKKADVHATLFGGKNLTLGKIEATELNIDSIPQIAFGALVGTRFYYNKFLGFFFEAGYSNYGFLSFGATYIIGKY